MIWGSFLSVPIVQRPRTRPFQGRDPGSNPGGDATPDWSIPVTWVTVHSEHIGNHFGVERILNRFEPTGLIVEVAQIVAHEGDEPDALTHLRYADVLAGKHVAEIHLPRLEADPTAAGSP